MKKTEMLKSDT